MANSPARSLHDVVIVGAARTPIGAFQGALAGISAPRLGSIAILAALERAGVAAEQVAAVYMGEVLQGGVGQAPARQAALFAGLPTRIPCVTVNKVCGSGLESVIEAARSIALGEVDCAVAGGMESMSNAPYFSSAMRGGARMGNTEFKDLMIHDGLWDPYNDMHMGMCGEKCAADFKFSRAAQDEYALESTRRAQKAQADGSFKAEIAPVPVAPKGGFPKGLQLTAEFLKGAATLVSEDEGPKSAKPEKIPGLKPAFKKDGTITAANAASINDGAAAVVLMSAERAKSARARPSSAASPRSATRRAIRSTFPSRRKPRSGRRSERANWKAGEVELWEINEAFAVVTMANAQLLGLDSKKVNIRGGAVVLGHPIGASGCRLLVTLLYAMKDTAAKKGGVSLCIGGGEGIALMVERD